MRRRPIVPIVAIIFVMLAAVVYFTLPGLSGKDPHLQANALFDQGIRCESKEDYACAEDKFGQAVKLYGQDGRYYFHLAQVQTKLGKYSAAMDNYRQAKALDPSNPDVLTGFDRAMSLQATQTATYLLVPTSVLSIKTQEMEPSLTPAPSKTPTQAISIVQSIFDEEFGIAGVATAAESPEDKITYRISSDEAYSGSNSLLINWTKGRQHWASLILGFDAAIDDAQKAQAGQLAVMNMAPPTDYAIQFFVKGVTGGERFTLKFQDQNLLFSGSLGNQAVYVKDVPDGVLELRGINWQAFCLPLADFATDYWIKEDFASFTEKDRQFDWSRVKQINIDAAFQSTEGAIYVDAMRIIRASDCPLPGE